jgi:hypothetical protein
MVEKMNGLVEDHYYDTDNEKADHGNGAQYSKSDWHIDFDVHTDRYTHAY